MIIYFVLLSAFLACKPEKYSPGSYDERLDDLAMGLYFGMERQDFLDHCWDLNQEGKTHHGTIGNMVMYIDSSNYDPKVVINFYPKFNENQEISELPMIFYYHAWAPWNKNELKQDTLQQQVVRFFSKRYDVEFEKTQAKEGYDVYHKIKGPVMIRVYKAEDEMLVKADIRNSVYMKKENNEVK